MPHENAFGFDLADRDKRLTLQSRYPPYWQVTEYGRALGYQHYGQGRTYWLARTRLKDGNYRQRRLGFANDHEGDVGLSFTEALDEATRWFGSASILSEAADARPIGSREELLICPIGDVFTIGHALDDYVEWKRLAAARSHFLTLVTLINHHIIPRIAAVPASDFNGEKLRYFVRDVLETPPKRGNQPVKDRRPISHMDEEELRKRKKTVNTLIGILRIALQMAWENGRYESERAWRCMRRLPVVDRPRVLHLDRPECYRLIEKCRLDLRQLVLGALYTGCRATELLRMNASHVGRDGPGVYVTPVKSYRPRFVFLPHEGLEFFRQLSSMRVGDEPLFLTTAGRPWFTNYRHFFKRAVLEAGLPAGFCFHGLRHTYASQLIQAGTPLIVVAEQLGHRDTETVSRTYGHLAPQIRAAEVAQRFTSLINIPKHSVPKLDSNSYAQLTTGWLS